MRVLRAIFLRELRALIEAPIALIVAIVFLLASGLATFYLGQFFENEEARLDVFFAFHPWLYLFFMPAVAMRLWAEERQQGTIELLMTWPVPLLSAILGKFFAAWLFAGLVLMLTFPIWLTVNYLGAPDNGVILAGYLGSFLMAGAYLAICLCMSVPTHNQVIAFIASAGLCAGFVIIGWRVVLDLLSDIVPPLFLEVIASFSFLTHFDAIQRGVIDLGDLVFFIIHIAVWLAAAYVLVDWITGARLDNIYEKDK